MNRLWPVFIVIAVALGVVADVVRPPIVLSPAGEQIRPTTTVLACPIVTDQGSTGSVQVASAERASVEVTFIPRGKGKPVILRSTVTPDRPRFFKTPTAVAGDASAIVRASSGLVAAAHVIRLPSSRSSAAGAGATACTSAGPIVTAVPHLRTLKARSVLSIFNPGSGDAEVSVSLSADGDLLFPRELDKRLISGHGRRDFNLGDFAFDAKDLTAIVTSTIGRVVVEALVRSPRGAALVSGVAPNRQPITAAGRSGPGARYSITLAGEDDAALDASFITATEQGRAAGLPPSLAPGGGTRISIPTRNAGAAVAYAAELTVGSPVVAGASWVRSRRGRDDEAIVTSAVPSSRWLGVTTGLAEGKVRAIIINPSADTATVTPQVRGKPGAVFELEPGKLRVVTIGATAGVFSYQIESTEPVVVFLESWGPVGKGIRGWSLEGTPLGLSRAAAVQRDPAIGIPAARR